MAVVAKARAAQLTSFRSITAAAEGLVTFRFCSSWWKARLLAYLGSSAAQGDAGGPGVPPLRTSSASLRSAPSPKGEGLRAATWGRPYGENRTGSVGLAKSGAAVEPQQRQFLQTQGPVARKKSQKATQILRAGNILPGPRGNPRKRGSRGWAAWRQGRQRRSCRLRPPLGGSLVPFCPCRKELAAGAAKLFL